MLRPHATPSSQPYLEVAARPFAVDITRVVDGDQADWPATAQAAALLQCGKRSTTEGNRKEG